MGYKIRTSERGALRLGETEQEASIRQNVSIILRTIKGSCPMYREFGMDAALIDRPIPAAKVLLFSQIREAVEAYEPRVRVVGVEFEAEDEMRGVLTPVVEVEIDDES